METLINHELVNQPPSKNYDLLPYDFDSGYFAGYVIKSLYDEKRYSINKNYNPKRFSFNTNNGVYKLYGLFNPAPITDLFINNLTATPPANIGEYSSLLTLNGLSCMTCFLRFSPGLYPIDSTYLTRFFSFLNIDDFNSQKNIPSFQRLGHIYLFALVNHDYSSE